MTEKEIKIALSKLDREEVVIEKDVEFKDSIFYLVYQKTEILLWNIIKENQRYNDPCFENRPKQELENIISFEGRRGTGKSSAMLSVQEALKNYKNNEFLKNTENPKVKNTNFYFHVLDIIDASSLEEEENFLEIVLANMFVDLREKAQVSEFSENNPYESRELYQLFSDIFEILININGTQKTNYYKEAAPLHTLSQLSNSRMLLKKMKLLVKKYLHYMKPSESYCDKNSFLIISVDDLDMHFKPNDSTSYQLLESIHRYLMIPNVIVFVSYSYLDLCAACEQHFNNLYPQSQLNEKHEKKRIKVQKMAVEYLDKVCPIYSRVHMPSLRKKDYQEKKDAKIIISKKEGTEVLTKFVNILWKDKQEQDIGLPIKKFIFLLKASLAGLYYDAKGEKRHFAESDNLRGLSQTYTFFLQLKKLQNLQNGGNQAVFKELLDDLYFRFAGEKLTRNDYSKFRNFLDVKIERRSRDILNDLHQQIHQSKELFENDSWTCSSEITYYGHHNEHSYSYGELLYFLYHASRKGIYCKELIWCILDSYTIMLTKLHKRLEYLYKMKEKNKDNDNARKEEIDLTLDTEKRIIRKKISDIIGTSVASSWSNVYMPLLLHNKSKEDKIDQYFIRLNDQDSGLIKAAAIKGNWVQGNWIFNLWDNEGKIPDTDNIEEYIKDNLQILEILCMFITGVFERKVDKNTQCPRFNFRPGVLYPDGIHTKSLEFDKEGPRIELHFNEICFNILNFANNLFQGEDFFNSLHEKLIPEYERYFKLLKRTGLFFTNVEITDEYVKDFFENNSLKQDVIAWSKYSFGFALPLYSFDMMYNIFKRRYQQQGIMPHSVPEDKYWDYVRIVYDDLGALLKEEDNFYFKNDDDMLDESSETDAATHSFYQNYIESPFIKFIIELDNEDERTKKRKEKFAVEFKNMLSIMANLV